MFFLSTPTGEVCLCPRTYFTSLASDNVAVAELSPPTIQIDHDWLAKIVTHATSSYTGCAMGSINCLVGIITKLVLQRLGIIISDKLIESYENAIWKSWTLNHQLGVLVMKNLSIQYL